jgi:hypothetical protein
MGSTAFLGKMDLSLSDDSKSTSLNLDLTPRVVVAANAGIDLTTRAMRGGGVPGRVISRKFGALKI